MTLGRDPITDEWLSEAGFKWRRDEGHPVKHWELVVQVPSVCGPRFDATLIELEVGLSDGCGNWVLFVTDRFGSRVFLGDIWWRRDVMGLVELVSQRPWDPSTHLSGHAWPRGCRGLPRRGVSSVEELRALASKGAEE